MSWDTEDFSRKSPSREDHIQEMRTVHLRLLTQERQGEFGGVLLSLERMQQWLGEMGMGRGER